jgi:hypothetical protein
MTKAELLKALEEHKTRSAWAKGVKAYAFELLENLENVTEDEQINIKTLKEDLLNGADDFKQYSWNGYSLIYDSDIAAALCSPSELKKTKNGELRPNSREEWLDVQARALWQAYLLICQILKDYKKEN